MLGAGEKSKSSFTEFVAGMETGESKFSEFLRKK